MSLIAKIIRIFTGRREPEEENARADDYKIPDERLGGGSPHNLGTSGWMGSFRDE